MLDDAQDLGIEARHELRSVGGRQSEEQRHLADDETAIGVPIDRA